MQERRSARSRSAWSGFVLGTCALVASGSVGFCAGGPCRDRLALDGYLELSKSARTAIERGLDLERQALESSDWDRLIAAARKQWTSAARSSKGCMLPHYLLGVSYFRTMLFDASKRWLENAVEGDAEFREAWIALARLRLTTREHDAALAASERAFALCGADPAAIEVRAHSLIRLDRLVDARQFLADLIAPVPTPDAWTQTVVDLRQELELAASGPNWIPKFVTETEHYRISTAVSQEFTAEIGHRVELIHQVYRMVFPEIEKPERKYEVWVYPDAESYRAAGAPEGSGGYYDRLFRRLVLYRFEPVARTFEVLQHEAFHQYLDDYLEVAPSWFNEGFGDYFGAFEHHRRGGKDFLRALPNRLRLSMARRIIQRDLYTPLPALMQMSQSQMYARAEIHYPQSWSLIWFLIEGGGSESQFAFSSSRRYVKVLKAYFQALRSGKNPIQAYERTFGRLDMKAIEKEWREFILALDPAAPDTR